MAQYFHEHLLEVCRVVCLRSILGSAAFRKDQKTAGPRRQSPDPL
jgi:hypothetical protein